MPPWGRHWQRTGATGATSAAARVGAPERLEPPGPDSILSALLRTHSTLTADESMAPNRLRNRPSVSRSSLWAPSDSTNTSASAWDAALRLASSMASISRVMPLNTSLADDNPGVSMRIIDWSDSFDSHTSSRSMSSAGTPSVCGRLPSADKPTRMTRPSFVTTSTRSGTPKRYHVTNDVHSPTSVAATR